MAAAAAALSTSSLFNIDSDSVDVDKLSHEIFSILENKFLFGYDTTTATTPLHHMKSSKHVTGKVRILTIDGSGATDGILAARSLVHLESCIRRKSGDCNAAVSDYFDVVSGSGPGGILAALLFTKAADGSGRPVFTAQEALNFLLENRSKIFKSSSQAGIFRRVFRPVKAEKERERLFRKTFGDQLTLKDTLKAVLIPCYDMSSRAPFLFSRADAVEMDGYDFQMKDVCTATCAHPAAVGAVDVKSVDGRTKIMAVDGGIAMNNPTAAAITHVLNNKQEFPFCSGVEDLLVVSLGNGESEFGNLSPSGCLRIAGEGASDLVDQAVSMAFGDSRTSNYVRVQATGNIAKSAARMDHSNNSNKNNTNRDILALTDEMLAQRNVESTLFEGKKIVESTNLKKLELFAGEVIKEEERRKTSILPTVALKQTSGSPARTSSATTLSSLSSSC
ncbi:patatin-like protein 7 [Argentina anserina]|uniref:patatin-like protein 7 n=1 Tax=Argentina anserina TaxID=57926 RepID=UPI00217633D3|nr:patatin-like protein 7 [Potentilla anserina]